MQNSKISWTTHTFNPWEGCTKVAPGCVNCYAEADRDLRRHVVKWGPSGTRKRTSDAYWKQPIKWNREAEKSGERPRVFCASLADVFEDWQGPIVDNTGSPLTLWNREYGYDPCWPEDHPGIRRATMNDLRADLFNLIDATPNLDWLLLTKRPENVRKMWPTDSVDMRGRHRKNVWLGTSFSTQKDADKNLVQLIQYRDLCHVLFVSAEPLLEDVLLQHDDLRGGLVRNWLGDGGLNWVIVGGESGRNARVCNVAWIRSIVEQCKVAGVPAFVKQLGSNVIGSWDERMEMIGSPPSAQQDSLVRWKLCDPKGGDAAEWPEDLRVREFPTLTAAR